MVDQTGTEKLEFRSPQANESGSDLSTSFYPNSSSLTCDSFQGLSLPFTDSWPLNSSSQQTNAVAPYPSCPAYHISSHQSPFSGQMQVNHSFPRNLPSDIQRNGHCGDFTRYSSFPLANVQQLPNSDWSTNTSSCVEAALGSSVILPLSGMQNPPQVQVSGFQSTGPTSDISLDYGNSRNHLLSNMTSDTSAGNKSTPISYSSPPKQTDGASTVVQTISTTGSESTGNAQKTRNGNTNTKGHVCSDDVIFVGEVQKPQPRSKSDVIFVRENYNRSGIVCLTPNKRLNKKSRSSPYARSISLDSAAEFKVTISETESSSTLSGSASLTSEWTYLGLSGLKTFDPKTTSLLEHLYNTGGQNCLESGPRITIKVPNSSESYELDLPSMKMISKTSKQEIVLFRKPLTFDEPEPQGPGEFPSHWSPQTNDIQLVDLNEIQHGEEWINIAREMRKSLPALLITSIQRVQNKKLWIRYSFQKAMLLDKNGSEQDVNEKLLFHGTRTTPPCRIWQSEDGFDMRYCETGNWGRGIYFAQDASYSNDFAHRLSHCSQRQIFVASVLTGHSKEMPPNKNLRRPPIRIPANAINPEVLFDSVTGISVRSRIYILYKFDMAYPSYVVTYYSN